MYSWYLSGFNNVVLHVDKERKFIVFILSEDRGERELDSGRSWAVPQGNRQFMVARHRGAVDLTHEAKMKLLQLSKWPRKGTDHVFAWDFILCFAWDKGFCVPSLVLIFEANSLMYSYLVMNVFICIKSCQANIVGQRQDVDTGNTWTQAVLKYYLGINFHKTILIVLGWGCKKLTWTYALFSSDIMISLYSQSRVLKTFHS